MTPKIGGLLHLVSTASGYPDPGTETNEADTGSLAIISL